MGAFVFDSNRNEWLALDRVNTPSWTKNFKEAYEFRDGKEANDFAIAYFGVNEEIQVFSVWTE